jgi:hypothetical protein
MTRRRYQVFISSTVKDLKQARHAVLHAILMVGQLPAGMELFVATDSESWDLITGVIDDSDYYVVVVGGRYGSTDRTGISYTEREHDYARNAGIPILAFLHEDPASLGPEKTEKTKIGRQRLSKFRRKLEAARFCAYWRTVQDLELKVATSLIQQINQYPRGGWVRASRMPESAVAPKVGEAPLVTTEVVRVQLRPGAVPTGFDVAAAKDVLAGRADRVVSFVVWSDTPQGQVFWSDQKKRLDRGQSLVPDARQAILKWIEEAERS